MKEQIAVIRNYLSCQPVVKAYLFGSASKGEAEIDSDIDIMVELSEEADLYTFIAMKNELESLLGRPVDLVSSRFYPPAFCLL